MTTVQRSGWALCAWMLVSGAGGCGGSSPTNPSTSGGVSAPVGGVAQFSVSPIADPVAGSLTALGNLNPPGHTLPTDHVYFYQQSLAGGSPFNNIVRTVYAPAKATVKYVIAGTGGEQQVGFQATSTFVYYFDHLTPRASGLSIGTVVEAREVVGTATSTLDLGAWDTSTTLTGFATPARYSDGTLHCVSPWKYFTEPLRSQLYAKMHRAPSASDRDGKIDLDVPGRLVGAWFDPSVPKTSEAAGPNSWTKQLGFVYDLYDPSIVRISIGGTIASPGVWGIESAAPRPETVSVGTGLVVYRLFYPDTSGRTYGVMLVQMTSDAEIRVEVVVGATTATAFSAAARTYVR